MSRVFYGVEAKSNFFFYVFSMVSAGLLISAGFAAIFGSLIQNISAGMFFVVIIVAMIGNWIVDYLFQKNIMINKLSTSLLLYGTSTVITGLFLSPVYLLALYGYADIVIQAFLGTVLLFISLCIYAYFSKKDFSSWDSILYAGCIAMLIVSVLKIILYIFVPAFIYNALSIGVSFLSILLSSGFVLFNLSILSQFYENHYGDTVALSRLGLLGAHLLFKQFVSIFLNLLNILLRTRKSRD